MSLTTFINEFTKLYNGEDLEPLAHQFKDYSEWMQTRDLSEQKDYWVREYSDEIPVLDIPLDYARPQLQSFLGSTTAIETGKELSTKIKDLAKETGTTEYMVLLASAMVLLGKYGNQEDVVIGSPISGRTHTDTENMLGMFVNTLAMRGRPEGEKSFREFLEEVKMSSLKAYENQEYPFEELVENVDVIRDLSRNPIFDIMLVLQNNEPAELEIEGVSVEYAGQESTIAKFDLTFNIYEADGNFGIMLEYCTELFRKETAENILVHYIELLKNATLKPE
jgi:non-ribosomal peptide synthetase component F